MKKVLIWDGSGTRRTLRLFLVFYLASTIIGYLVYIIYLITKNPILLYIASFGYGVATTYTILQCIDKWKEVGEKFSDIEFPEDFVTEITKSKLMEKN